MLMGAFQSGRKALNPSKLNNSEQNWAFQPFILSIGHTKQIQILDQCQRMGNEEFASFW
jgi:hypothetical protein